MYYYMLDGREVAEEGWVVSFWPFLKDIQIEYIHNLP